MHTRNRAARVRCARLLRAIARRLDAGASATLRGAGTSVPNGEHVAALIARIEAMSDDRIRMMQPGPCAPWTRRGLAEGLVTDAREWADRLVRNPRYIASSLAGMVSQGGYAYAPLVSHARNAVVALVLRDHLPRERYLAATAPLASMIGPVHPDDQIHDVARRLEPRAIWG